MVGYLLSTGTDDDLLRGTGNASGKIEIFSYFGTQDLFSLGIPLEEQHRGMLSDHLVHGFFPFVEVKAVRIVDERDRGNAHGFIRGKSLYGEDAVDSAALLEWEKTLLT